MAVHRIFKASVPDSNVDVIFVQGTEPSYKWRAYTAELLVLRGPAFDYVILVGACWRTCRTAGPFRSAPPRTTPRCVNGWTWRPRSTRGRWGLWACSARWRCWRAPDRVALGGRAALRGPGPVTEAQLALLHRIEELLQVPLDTTELVEEADAGNAAWTSSPPRNRKLRRMSQLEEAKDTADLPEASGESIAREFERYLKRRGKDKP